MSSRTLELTLSPWKASPVTTLVGLSYSPWTQKARWALDLCGAPYRWQSYTPTVSEFGLRFKMRKFSGTVSVPVLLTKDGALEGAMAIAEYADGVAQHGDGTTLFFDRAGVVGFNRLADDACDEYRIKVAERVLQSPEAQRESMKGVVPSWMQARTTFVARHVTKRLMRKYGSGNSGGAMRTALTTLRRTLDERGCDYLLGEFSFADMAMSAMFDMIDPPSNDVVYRSAAVRKCWRDPELATEFADLVEWRDRIYATHRSPC